jgi:hypothetical protein
MVQTIMKLADWGLGLTDKDLHDILKTYLDFIGANAFKNNKTGHKFLTLFKTDGSMLLVKEKHKI